MLCTETWIIRPHPQKRQQNGTTKFSRASKRDIIPAGEKLFDQYRDAINLKHYSPRTDDLVTARWVRKVGKWFMRCSAALSLRSIYLPFQFPKLGESLVNISNTAIIPNNPITPNNETIVPLQEALSCGRLVGEGPGV